MPEHSNQRRDFVKKAAYMAPAILTLAAAASYAKPGSEKINVNRLDDRSHSEHSEHPEHPEHAEHPEHP